MVGTLISINENDITSGIITDGDKQIYIYKLPSNVKDGMRIEYETRISRRGNKYAIYRDICRTSNGKVSIVDFEKRMTSMEYLALYYYQLLKKKQKMEFTDEGYKNWILNEELIESYNAESEEIKQNIARLCAESYKSLNTKFISERWNYEKPVIWKDRKKTSYFIRQLTESHKFEVFVDTLFSQHNFDIGLYYGREQQYAGETSVGIEIKLDKKLKETNNVYIEYQERMHRDGKWVNSGILKNDNTKMIFIGDIEKYYIFRKKRLLEYYQKLIVNREDIVGARKVAEKEHGTSKGFIMNGELANRENISVVDAIDLLQKGL